MKAPACVVVDFETLPIARRPAYPPRPVGVAIAWPGEEPRYFVGRVPIIEQLNQVWLSELPILCHNAKFDVAVACEGLGLPELPWARVHDTMLLAYLCDPHARSLGLKPLAEDLLGWPPEERNELDDWIWAHCRELEQTYGGKVSKSKLGAWIHAAPVELVGPYACGDVARTRALWEHLWPIVQQNGMGAAYDRERRLLPILMDNERRGIRVDLERLELDALLYEGALQEAEHWLRRELRASGLNFDADRDVAAVLLERGVVPQQHWSLTKSGQLSTSKENLLPEFFTDPRIASALGYRNRLKTCLEMFMKTWIEQASASGGTIHPQWNQTRGERGGTRTGRPSCTDPNMLNLSKTWEGRDDGYVHPEFLGVAKLPLVRQYVLPDDGEVWLHRDFDGQEMRVFADFEQGALWRGYQANPALDPHEFVGAEAMRLTGRTLERTKIKVLNFQGVYGGGVPAAQRKLRCSYAEAKEFKAFHDKALPGRKRVNEEITRIVRRGDPIRTWGGRLYYPERPGPDGRDKIYKLLNYAVQGSAADLTKQALIDWNDAVGAGARFLVTVYDEIDLSVDKSMEKEHMALLRSVMEAPRLSVPMRSSGKRGPTWGDLEKCE
jgi:DNA polymerase I-like protein with 3'-5' exonuclease and polymerase domains